MIGVAEAFSGSGGQGRENLLETHAGTGHPKKFLGSVKLLDVADVRAKKDLAAGFGIGS
jgi:hypothetical protein